MLVLLSPSKNLHNVPHEAHRYSELRMGTEAVALIQSLKKLNPAALRELMDINEQLARLNYNRYHAFAWPHTPDTATAAIYTFRGEVYQGFDANSMTLAQAEQADKQIRILSGLYGVLRPLDLIQPYRLEMGTTLSIKKAKNLYSFWGTKISELLRDDIVASKSKEVINLASQEYMTAVDPAILGVPVVDIQFLEDRNGKLQFLSYNAKRSRGWMARYIVNHKISKSSALKGFNEQGYSYRGELSDQKKMVFVR